MKVLKQLCVLLLALGLLTGCAPSCSQGDPKKTEDATPLERVDMLQSDIVPDSQLNRLQADVWPQREDRPIISDYSVYSQLLSQKPGNDRFLTYEDLKFLGDFVSYASADGNPHEDGFTSDNYAYTFHDSLLNLTWTLYVIEGVLEVPNEDYQPAQDLFYEFRDLYKDNYAEDMRTQAIVQTDKIVEVRHGDVLFFYQGDNQQGDCVGVMWNENGRVYFASGNFSGAELEMDSAGTRFLSRLLKKSTAQKATESFLSE